jgi:probable rRNA maturation factor
MTNSEEKLSILNTTKGKLPRLPFLLFKDTVLGKKYDLSIAFVGDTVSRRHNRERRGKDKPTDILSFPLTDTSGEILINLNRADMNSKKFDRNPKNFLAFLLIHGMLHLKGHVHGSTMEHEEEKFRKKLGI